MQRVVHILKKKLLFQVEQNKFNKPSNLNRGDIIAKCCSLCCQTCQKVSAKNLKKLLKKNCQWQYGFLLSGPFQNLQAKFAGWTISNGREPKSCLGQIMNFKLISFASKQYNCTAWMRPLLDLAYVLSCKLK